MTREEIQAGQTTVWVDRAERRLTVERTFDAPRELVWDAWTDPEHTSKWWGPRGWATTNKSMDVKPGGVWHYCMTGPESAESWGKAVYREVVPPQRLVYYDVFSDADGAANENMPGMLITIEFADVGGKTKLTSTTEFATAEQLQSILDMGVVQGLTETWDRLEEYIAAERSG